MTIMTIMLSIHNDGKEKRSQWEPPPTSKIGPKQDGAEQLFIRAWRSAQG